MKNTAIKTLLIAGVLAFTTIAAHAEYQQVNLTVFGMDCAPCAHAIHVSMKGIQGVNTVDVDLNTGLVTIKLASGNNAAMRQFNQAVEKNGFTHKDAIVTARGKLTGTASAPFFEVAGTQDRFALTPASAPANVSALLGKTVTITGVLPQVAKGKVPDTLRYNSIAEAQ
ncbi:MAG TPA: heavy metal-associated domain-containing protein [Chloroflexota bacterium]